MCHSQTGLSTESILLIALLGTLGVVLCIVIQVLLFRRWRKRKLRNAGSSTPLPPHTKVMSTFTAEEQPQRTRRSRTEGVIAHTKVSCDTQTATETVAVVTTPLSLRLLQPPAIPASTTTKNAGTQLSGTSQETQTVFDHIAAERPHDEMVVFGEAPKQRRRLQHAVSKAQRLIEPSSSTDSESSEEDNTSRFKPLVAAISTVYDSELRRTPQLRAVPSDVSVRLAMRMLEAGRHAGMATAQSEPGQPRIRRPVGSNTCRRESRLSTNSTASDEVKHIAEAFRDELRKSPELRKVPVASAVRLGTQLAELGHMFDPRALVISPPPLHAVSDTGEIRQRHRMQHNCTEVIDVSVDGNADDVTSLAGMPAVPQRKARIVVPPSAKTQLEQHWKKLMQDAKRRRAAKKSKSEARPASRASRSGSRMSQAPHSHQHRPQPSGKRVKSPTYENCEYCKV